MDSTRAIIRLWRLCIPVEVEAGGDGAIPVDVLKRVLEHELHGKEGALDCVDVDDILYTYLQPDASGVVGFLEFWKGMEEILVKCGSLRSRLSPTKAASVVGFRFLRSCVLEILATQGSQGRQSIQVSELRYFIMKTIEVAGEEGEGFWREQAESLPGDEVLVTGDEVATALLAWLEQLVDGDDEDDDGPSFSGLEDEDCPEGPGVAAARVVAGEALDPDPEQPSTVCDTSLWLPLPPAPGPKGPPPRRSVLAGRPPSEQAPGSSGPPMGASGSTSTAASSFAPAPRRSCAPLPSQALAQRGPGEVAPGSGTARGSRPSRRKASVLECALAGVLQRPDRRPSGLTKEEAAEWRDAMEFHTALRRRLLEQPPEGEEELREFTFADFYELAHNLVRTTARRSSTRGLSPRLRSANQTRGAEVLRIVLHHLERKRKAEALGAWLAAQRRVRSPPPVPLGGGEAFDLFAELLRSQCQTAVVLERRVQSAGRRGAIAGAQCLERLIRAALKGGWARWSQLSSRQPLGQGRAATDLQRRGPPFGTGGGTAAPHSAGRGAGRGGGTLLSASSPLASSTSPQASPPERKWAQGFGGYPTGWGKR